MDIEKLDLLGSKEARYFLGGISANRLGELVDKYKIPHKHISCGKIFLKSDLVFFQESRKGKMKHGKKST